MASLSYNDCCVKSFSYGENLEKLNPYVTICILQTTHKELFLFLTYPQSPSLCEPATPSEDNAAVAGARGVTCCQAGINICCVLPDHVCCSRNNKTKSKRKTAMLQVTQSNNPLKIIKVKFNNL